MCKCLCHAFNVYLDAAKGYHVGHLINVIRFLVVDRQLGKCILNAKKGYVRGNISCRTSAQQ